MYVLVALRDDLHEIERGEGIALIHHPMREFQERACRALAAHLRVPDTKNTTVRSLNAHSSRAC